MTFSFKIKKEKYLYYIFALISLLITFLIYLILKDFFLPLSLKVIEQKDVEANHYSTIYHDFDQDGISEKVSIFRKNDRGMSILELTNSSLTIVQDFNFSIETPLKYESILFADIDNDLKDDLFVFYPNRDSVFLDIIEYKEEFPRHKYFITSKPDSVTRELWDVDIYPIGLKNINNEKHIYFYILGQYCHYPRNVYDYNISKRRIENVFVTNAWFLQAFFFDITNDGTDELIISTYAAGNISDDKKFSDQNAYLFILDLNLKLIFDPIVSYRSAAGILINKVTYDFNNYIIFTKMRSTSTFQSNINLLDKYGKIINSNTIYGKSYFSIISNQLNKKKSILFFLLDNTIYRLNNNLVPIKKTLLPKQMGLLKIISFNDDFDNVVLTMAIKQPYELIAYSKDLKKIGELKATNQIKRSDFRYTITEKLVGQEKNTKYFHFNGFKKNFLLSIKENPHHRFLYLYFLLTFFIIFLLVIGTHQIGKRISLYLNYFIHSLRDSSTGILVVNGLGKIIYKNFRLHEILSVGNINDKNTDYKTLLSPYKELIDIIDSAIKNDKKITQKFTIPKGDEIINGEIRVIPFVSFFRMTYAYTIEISDFSKMLLSDRMKSWSSTAQKIAHDIKTPLSTIQLNLKAIQRRMEKEDVPNQEKYNEDISRIRDELERIKTLSKNFLKFANLDKPDYKKVNIKELIKNSFKQFDNYTNENIHIEFDFDEDAKYVKADPNQLEQLFHILIENSIDSMKGKGTIKVSCTLIHDLENTNIKWVEIEFSDNGCGISEENLSKVFEPYFTTKVDGTGFGLALAHKIIKDHNGKINIYSKENIGTTIRILLPATDNNKL